MNFAKPSIPVILKQFHFLNGILGLGIVSLLILTFSFACSRLPAQQTFQISYSDRKILPSTVIEQASTDPAHSFDDLPFGATFSPDGSLVLVVLDDGNAFICATQNPQRRLSLKGHTDLVTCGVWSHNGRLVATCGYHDDPTVRIWDAETGHTVRILHAEKKGMYPITAAFSPDDSLFSWKEEAESGLCAIHVLSMTTGQEASTREDLGLTNDREKIAISPDNRHLYWLDSKWDLATSPQLKLSNHGYLRLPVLAYSSDIKFGYMIAHLFEHDDRDNAPNALYQVDLSTGQIVTRWQFSLFHGEHSPSNDIAVSPDGTKAALVRDQLGIRLIDLLHHRDIATLIPVNPADSRLDFGQPQSVCFSPDGKSVLGTTFRGIYIWTIP